MLLWARDWLFSQILSFDWLITTIWVQGHPPLLKSKIGDKTHRSNARKRKRKPPKRNVTTEGTSQSDDTHSQPEQCTSCSSAQKLKVSTTDGSPDSSQVAAFSNCIVNVDILTSLLERFNCLNCNGSDTSVTVCPVYGLATRVNIQCNDCDVTTSEDLCNTISGNRKSNTN